jgi:hypothetical protein
VSLDAQDWVWEHSASKGTARLVLLAVADKASGPECSAYAGTTFLVKRSRAARSSVVVAVDRLLESGEMKIIDGRTGPRGETCYSLPLAASHRRKGGPESGPVRKSDPSGNQTPGGPESGPTRSGNETPSGPDFGPQNTDNAEPPVETQNYKERPTPPATEDGDSDLFGPLAAKSEEIHKQRAKEDLSAFGDFWLLYPKKKDRAAALKAWKAAVESGVDPARITQAAKSYAQERRDQDAKYTKFPATWLNKGCYDDEPDEPARPHLRAVSGGHVPYRNPDNQDDYDQPFWSD